MRIALRYAHDADQAQDIVQSAFVQVLTKIASFRADRGTFEAWLSRIVVNEALQLYRKNRLISEYPMEGSLAESVEAPLALEQLQAEDILRLLHLLPDGFRLVFNLAVMEGYTHKEIADKLGISESASRSQLSRAKQRMRRLIGQQNHYHAERPTTK